MDVHISMSSTQLRSCLKDKERIKYEDVWGVKAYRKVSPGELVVHEFLERVDPRCTILDIGCGTGRASKRMEELGYKPILFDIAFNCLDVDVHIPVHLGCIWEDINLSADWGFCTDVMEHIPEKRVDQALDNIAKSCRNVYFRIYLHKDNGKFVDQPLHLTVKSASWWLDKLEQRFDSVSSDSNGLVATFWCNA